MKSITEKNPLVNVCCLTFNHAAFIGQAIESILMQKTTFPFNIIVHDDASSDSTAIIIREYAEKHHDRIFPILQKGNQYSKGVNLASKFVFPNCFGKYISFCEGDDFWTDPYKLQKQVEFLEANPDYGLVHGDVNHLDQKTGKIVEAFNKTNNIRIPSGDIFDFLMMPSHSVKTMTVCFRRDLFEKHYLQDTEIMSKDWRLLDISIWLALARHSKIHYMDEVFATYRLLPESMSRTKNPDKLHGFHQKIHEIRAYFAERYGANDEIKTMLKENYCRSNLVDAYNIGNKALSREAYSCLKQSGITISQREKILYYATQYTWLHPIIDLFKSR